MADTPAQPGQQSGYGARYDYRVDILRRRNLVTAQAGDTQLAQSDRTLLVDEQDHGLVFYFPREAVNLAALAAIDHTSRCPYKGTASYWALAGATDAAPVAWSYESPYPQVAQIAGHIAFYQDRVTVSLGTAPFTPGGK